MTQKLRTCCGIGALRGWAALLLLVTVTTLASEAAATDSPPKGPTGLRYFLPKSMIVLKVKKTTTFSVNIDESLEKVKKEQKDDVQVDVATSAIADTRAAYALDAVPSAWKKKGLTASVNASGFLTAFNGTNEGKAGDVLRDVLRTAVTIIAFIGAADASGTKAPGKGAPEECASVDISGLPRETAAFVRRTAEGCHTWRLLLQKRADLSRREAAERQAERELEGAKTQDFDRALRRLEVEKELVASTGNDLKAAEKRLSDGVSAYAKSLGIGIPPEAREGAWVIEPSDLPKFSSRDSLWSSVKKETSDGTLMYDIAREFKVAMFLDGVGDAPVGSGVLTDQGSGHGDEIAVAYRQSRPHLLRICKVTDKELECKRVEQVELFIANDMAQALVLKGSAWADRSLSLQLDQYGRPTSMTRASDATAARVAAAAASSVQDATDTYKTTLGKVSEILASRRQMSLSDLEEKAARLKKEKEILDTQIALGGASVEERSTLEKLKIELEITQARLALERTEGTSESAVALAKLEAEVATLKAQIEVLRLQAEKAAASSSSP